MRLKNVERKNRNAMEKVFETENSISWKGVHIEGWRDLKKAINEYGAKFQNSYATFGDIRRALRDNADNNAPGVIFGMSVAGEWEDRCYTFKLTQKTARVAYYEYLGISKT